MQIDYDKITRDFILGEHQDPTLAEYLNVISELVERFKPQTTSDRSRISVMKEHLRKAKRQARLMEERLKILEEQVKIIEEAKEDEE